MQKKTAKENGEKLKIMIKQSESMGIIGYKDRIYVVE